MKLLTTAEVAERLGRTARTVVRLVEAGDLTPVTKTPGIRGAYLFAERDVTRYLTKRDRAAS